MTTTAKKRKRRAEESEEFLSLSNYIQLRSRRIVVQVSTNHQLLNSSSDQDVSCCLSNRSSEGTELPDLEAVEFEVSAFSGCNERRETARCEQQPLSDELDSAMSKLSPKVANTTSTTVKMPTEAELEEFFAAAEKDIQKQFVNKYNYDIVKDIPLEGSYEWIPLKP